MAFSEFLENTIRAMRFTSNVWFRTVSEYSETQHKHFSKTEQNVLIKYKNFLRDTPRTSFMVNHFASRIYINWGLFYQKITVTKKL
jgi:hypothetical protein